MKLHSKSFFESILKLTIFKIINNLYVLFNAKILFKMGYISVIYNTLNTD